MIKYLLDENVDPAFWKALKRREPELVIWRMGRPASPARGTLDPEILLWCEANNFILVTNNRKSMPGHLRDHLAAGRHIPGIFLLNEDMSLGETVEELVLIAGASFPEEYQDQIRHLPITYKLDRQKRHF